MPNLIQNPSFETGLLNWKFVNVVVASDLPYEGAAVARMGAGTSTLFQDVLIKQFRRPSFRLSFGLAAPEGPPGNITANVQWLDECCRVIGNALCLNIPGITIFEQEGWLPYSVVTDAAPPGASFARVIFSKSATGAEDDFLDVDLVEMNEV